MSANHDDYLKAVEKARTRPLTRRETNAIARNARIARISFEEAEQSFRNLLIYYEGSACASYCRSIERGDFKTVNLTVEETAS